MITQSTELVKIFDNEFYLAVVGKLQLGIRSEELGIVDAKLTPNS